MKNGINMFKGKKVMVTGSEGLIGQELCILLEDMGAEVLRFDFKRTWSSNEYDKVPMDVRDFKLILNTMLYFRPEYVFHLFGIKGSPKMTNEKPVTFMGNMLQGDTNVIIAAQNSGVRGFLYTSSIAVENPQSDKYPAWAKTTAETLIDAMRIQYPNGTMYCVVRPANVYGRFDNFQNPNAMVITSLINKAMTNDIIEVWGDGSQVRDFINAKDVAKGMIQAMEEMPTKPVNLCSGSGVRIKDIANRIGEIIGKEVKFGSTEAVGEQRRVMELNWDFKPEINIYDGVEEVIQWLQKQG